MLIRGPPIMKVFIATGVNRLTTTGREVIRTLDIRPLRLDVGYSTDARTNTSQRPSWIRSLEGQYKLGTKP